MSFILILKKNISLLKKGFGFLQMVEVFKHTHL